MASSDDAHRPASYAGIDINILLPNEILILIFSHADSATLLLRVPRVCTRWRNLCQQLEGVALNVDGSWCHVAPGHQNMARYWSSNRTLVGILPVEVICGWKPQAEGGGGGGGGCGALMADATTAVTFKTGWHSLFPGMTTVDFECYTALEGDIVIALAQAAAAAPPAPPATAATAAHVHSVAGAGAHGQWKLTAANFRNCAKLADPPLETFVAAYAEGSRSSTSMVATGLRTTRCWPWPNIAPTLQQLTLVTMPAEACCAPQRTRSQTAAKE